VRSERGAIRGLLLLIALVLGGWFVLSHWHPLHLYRRFSSNIELTVNRQLYAAGVYDHQIVSQVRREKSRWGVLVWVESDRRIQAESPAQIPRIVDRLREAAQRHHCQFERRDSADGVEIEIHQAFMVFQRIALLNPAREVEKNAKARPIEVAIVIDDVAYDVDQIDRFAKLDVPLTFAILPRDRRTKELAAKATELHFPIILHLPMEPIDLVHNNPGGAGLYLQMTPEQLHQQFVKDVASVPNIVGINNHMGSAFTEDPEKMALVMRWVKQRNLFFLDSRTSLHSVVPKIAREYGVPCRVNDTFLDNSDTVEGIEKQLDLVMHLALRRKHTIAIGHYRRKHLIEALEHKIPEFRAHGVSFVGLPAMYQTK
jgi:polysaccharide deacetylase 2 family uncharacterized protein YibQ